MAEANQFSISTDISLLSFILMTIGMFFMFSKLKLKRWWAFVPFYNRYKLAVAVGAEEDAYVFGFSNILQALLSAIWQAMNDNGSGYSLIGVMILVLAGTFAIINFIYGLRIYSSLCTTFGRSKRYLFLWAFFEGIMMLIWGLSKKFVPTGRNFEHNLSAAGDSGVVAEELSEGLTINIRKRSTRKKFREKVMLRDIHLNIKPGTMVLLLGGSGAGKTTFFNAITGYEKADAKITLDGYDVYSEFDKMKYEIGFVPQQELLRNTDTVIRTLTDSANLRLPKNITSKEKTERINQVMEVFGLTNIKDNIISKQSGGQKKRISIAMEYISNPSLFILDEPDSGLDGILARELMQHLHDISREGKIVIVVTHTPDRVIDLFDEVIVLAKDNNRTGRLVYHGPVNEAREFFGKDTMEEIVKVINRPDEGGDGRADELIEKFGEVRNENN